MNHTLIEKTDTATRNYVRKPMKSTINTLETELKWISYTRLKFMGQNCENSRTTVEELSLVKNYSHIGTLIDFYYFSRWYWDYRGVTRGLLRLLICYGWVSIFSVISVIEFACSVSCTLNSRFNKIYWCLGIGNHMWIILIWDCW